MKLLMSIIDGNDPHLVIRRYGEPGTVRVYLYEARRLVAALWAVAAGVAGQLAGGEASGERAYLVRGRIPQ